MKKLKLNAMNFFLILLLSLTLSLGACSDDEDETIEPNNNQTELPDITGYPIAGTNQTIFYGDAGIISEPSPGDAFYGQNAHYPGNTPQYVDNGDGTATDMVTGLMWQSSFDHNGDGEINYADKKTYAEILEMVEAGVSFAGYDDWRLPSIKEQYSLIIFSGKDISGFEGTSTDDLTPFINTDVFEYAYGDLDAGERLIDVQCASTNVYVGSDIETMVFGVNFADGRIKGYGTSMMSEDKAFNYLLVRGNESYGINQFVDNGDGTVSDQATGLMWMQDDSGEGMIWEEALALAESTEFAGHSDWRLPDVKELQSLVDYSRSPNTTNSAAIDPLFNCTEITNEAGQADYGFYWSSTTHANWTTGNEGAWGAYVSFGRAMGNMQMPSGPPMKSTEASGRRLPPPPHGNNFKSGEANWIDVHGAGAQRSDPKSGDPSVYADGHGPQGDAVRIYNYVRLVRNID